MLVDESSEGGADEEVCEAAGALAPEEVLVASLDMVDAFEFEVDCALGSDVSAGEVCAGRAEEVCEYPGMLDPGSV